MGVESEGEEPSADMEIKTEDLIVMEPQVEAEAVEQESPAPAEAEPATAPETSDGLALIRVLGDTDSFLGPDQRSYNLRKEDVLEIPVSIANILIKNKKAELFSA